MAIFRREVPVKIIYDEVELQLLSTLVSDITKEVIVVLERLQVATDELIKARKDVDKAIAKLQAEKRRPTIRNSG